jgi:hypothetical protein
MKWNHKPQKFVDTEIFKIVEKVLASYGGLVSPAGLPDLSQAELARSLPTCVLARAIGAQSDYLDEFLANPLNQDILPGLERFRVWSDANTASGGEDQWFTYLAQSRADLLKSVWGFYDPEGDFDDILRELVGDQLIGAAIWFSFLADTGVISAEDESSWCTVWNACIVNDFICDIKEGVFDDVD